MLHKNEFSTVGSLRRGSIGEDRFESPGRRLAKRDVSTHGPTRETAGGVGLLVRMKSLNAPLSSMSSRSGIQRLAAGGSRGLFAGICIVDKYHK